MSVILKATQALILLLCLFSLANANEEVYKSVDEQGNVTFTDQAEEGAEAVEVKPTNTVTLPEVPPLIEDPLDTQEETAETEEKVSRTGYYKKLEILYPEQDLSIRDIELPTSLDIRVALQPELLADEGHGFRYYINGAMNAELTTLSVMRVEDLYRGAYMIKVIVVDEDNQQLIESETVEFAIHQNSVLTNPSTAQPSHPIARPPVTRPAGGAN